MLPMGRVFMLAAVTLVAAVKARASETVEAGVLAALKKFEDKFGGSHFGLGDDREGRLRALADNMDHIEKWNREPHSSSIGVNKFATLSAAEFGALFSWKRPEGPSFSQRKLRQYHGEELPDQVDWRKEGAVTPVKVQKQCSAGYAFAATGAMEAVLQIASGNLTSLSEQQLVDCSHEDSGCHGGNPFFSMTYAEGSGMCTEASYTYDAVQHKECRAKGCDVGFPPGAMEVWHVAQLSPLALKFCVADSPVSTGVCSSNALFRLYTGGVVGADCVGELDHGVLVVGYGRDEKLKMDYWLVKNSWGADWGEDGYIRLARDDGTRGPGTCGVQEDGSLPSMKPAELQPDRLVQI